MLRLHEIYNIVNSDQILQTYFASSNNATIPAANGAAAEVPVWLTVQPLLTSIVACKFRIHNLFDIMGILNGLFLILVMHAKK